MADPQFSHTERSSNGILHVFFSEGMSFRIRPPFSFELEPDILESVVECERLEQAGNCYHKALSLLARREHSRLQLKQKLLLRKFDSSVSEDVLNLLTEEGSLSNARFAETWVRQRMNSHPEGQSRLIAGLQQRGVGRSDAGNAIHALLEDSPDIFAHSCLNYLLKLHRQGTAVTDLEEKAKKRGFNKSIIADCAGEFYNYTGQTFSPTK